MNLSLAYDSATGITQDLEIPDWVYDILQDDTEQRRFWVTKGLGAGGTFGAAMWHYIMCLINYRSSLSWAIAPTFQQVADTLIPSFAEVLTQVFGLSESVDYTITRSQFPRIELHRHEQTILFKSANKPERFVGPSISHVTMTEPGLIKRQAYEKSSARLRCPKAFRLQYLAEGSPEGMGDFFEQEANFEEGIDEERNARRITLWTHDNPTLGSGYVKNLQKVYSHDAQKLESYIYGRFVPFSKSTAYWEFKHRFIKLDLAAIPELPLCMSWDWNYRPLSWVALQKQPVWIRGGGKYDRYTVLGECSGNAQGILDAVAEFVKQFPPNRFGDTEIEIDGGCDGYYGSHLSSQCAFDQVLTAMRKYYRNVRVVAARKAPLIKDRLEKHNALFAYGLLVIASWCRQTIKSHELTNLKPNTSEILKPKDDKWSHWGDALGYALFRMTKNIDLEDPSSKQIYGFN